MKYEMKCEVLILILNAKYQVSLSKYKVHCNGKKGNVLYRERQIFYSPK